MSNWDEAGKKLASARGYRAAWLHDAKWGIFVHCLAGYVDSANGGADVTADAWNHCVDNFDVDALAAQADELGAGYVGITLGQNSGHYCCPNPTYDRIVGRTPSKLSKRDLVSDLQVALNLRNISLIAYVPSGAPHFDELACDRLRYDKSNYSYNDPSAGAGRQPEFQRLWAEVVSDWSTRFGRKVRGWWVDGAYHYRTMYQHVEEPNFYTLGNALRAGNPDAIIAFNTHGSAGHPTSITEVEDYTAGEVAESLPVSAWHLAGAGSFTTLHRFINGAQLHVLTFVGPLWGQGDPRLPDQLAAGYSRFIVEQGGAITWDVRVDQLGRIVPSHMAQLRAIGEAVRDARRE